MIKLVLSDVDGTLVKDGTSDLNPEYYQVIRDLKKKGIIFAVASGRSFDSIASLFAPVVNDIIIVAENGAYINCRDYDIHEDVIDKELFYQLVDDIRLIDGGIIVACCKKKTYVDTDDEKFLDMICNGYGNNIERIGDVKNIKEDIIKVSIYHHIDAVAVAGDFIDKWKPCIHAVCSGTNWVDCMNISTNKGSALRSIQKTLSIKKEETMVFGDNLNDIEMIENAGYSFAVGNARDEVKAAAINLADTNINDGVLKELKKLL